MSEPAFEHPSVKIAPSNEPLAKPKISRRPAKFVRPQTSAEILPMADVKIEYIATPASEQPTPPATRPWQEDARFGIALMAAIVIINLLVVFSLSQPETPPVTVQKNVIVDTTEPEPASVNVLDDRAKPVEQ